MMDLPSGAVFVHNAATRSPITSLASGPLSAGVSSMLSVGKMVWCALEDGSVCVVDALCRKARFRWQAHSAPVALLKGTSDGAVVTGSTASVEGKWASALRVWHCEKASAL